MSVPVCSSYLFSVRLFSILCGSLQQSTDGQGDTLGLGIDIGDLDLNLLTLSQG